MTTTSGIAMLGSPLYAPRNAEEHRVYHPGVQVPSAQVSGVVTCQRTAADLGPCETIFELV